MKISHEHFDSIYICSDTHFGHKNICKGVTEWDLSNRTTPDGNTLGVRDFNTIEDMNQAIVDNINNLVPKDATLFHLGDWSFGGKHNIEIFRNMLNVETIHLITGNHDEHIQKGHYDHLFTTRQKYLELEVGSLHFVLFHFPVASWNNIRRGSYHLHGHQHWQGDKRFGNGKKMDVGVDGNDMKPYKLTEVVDLLKDRKYVDENDHHS